MEERICPSGSLGTPALRCGPHSQATIHVNSFTVPSGTLRLHRENSDENELQPPSPPPSRRFHSLPLPRDPSSSQPHPGVLPLRLRKVRKFLPESARRGTHGAEGPGVPGQRRSGHTGCRPGLTAPPGEPGFANWRASPIWGRGEERGAGGRRNRPAAPGREEAEPRSPGAARLRGPGVRWFLQRGRSRSVCTCPLPLLLRSSVRLPPPSGVSARSLCSPPGAACCRVPGCCLAPASALQCHSGTHSRCLEDPPFFPSDQVYCGNQPQKRRCLTASRRRWPIWRPGSPVPTRLWAGCGEGARHRFGRAHR